LFWKKFIPIFLRGCVIVGLIFLCPALNLPWIDDFERFTIDKRFQIRGNRPPSNDLVIVGIDSASIAAIDRPFSTWGPIHAEFLQAMAAASASCVFFDFTYDSRFDRIVREMVIEHLAKFDIQIPPNVSNLLGFETPLIKAFIESKKRGLKVILGFFAEKNFSSSVYPLFQVAWKAFINLNLDPDLVVRTGPICARDKKTGQITPSAALAIASELRKTPFSVASEGLLVLGEKPILSLGKEFDGVINFCSSRSSYASESFKDVLADIRNAPDKLRRFAGKAVLVGIWQFDDVKNVPAGRLPGVEIHANLVENILNDCFLRPTSPQFLINVLLFFLMYLSLAFALNVKIGIFTMLFSITCWAAATVVSFEHGLLIKFSPPFVYLFFHGIFESFWFFYFLEKESKRVRNLFSRYVNDSVIEWILKNPQESIFQGMRRKICIMFVDIRGFTHFSESRDPKDVVTFLNNYFGHLTEIVFRHDGVVDKFLGDGLMAFFNAPIENPDFVKNAVECCIEIREFSQKSSIFFGNGSFVLKIGIALHVGEALIGNIGSERKMEYTAIGDTVNTTSRLESLNKEFKTDIIVSEAVKSEVADSFEFKDLGETPIRGKEQSLRLFELIGRKNRKT